MRSLQDFMRRVFFLVFLFLVCNLSMGHLQERREQGDTYMTIDSLTIKKIDRMIDVGERALHCRVYGEGGPTVVLVSGLGAPQDYWNSVVPDIAGRTTVITYDRAGIGKSKMNSLPVHGLQSAKELRTLLEKLQVPKPYILVGHSYGGKVVRLFASLYPEKMGGLLLVDSSHEDMLEEQRKVLTGEDLKKLENMVEMLQPPENPQTELDYNSMTIDQLRESNPLPSIPLTVLVSGDRMKTPPPMYSKAGQEKILQLRFEMGERLASLIPGGKLIVVEGAGHNIHVDKPAALIDPVCEMIDAIRN